ncbi:type II toxin-antitoxin system RelE/ParE family toxin [Hassallia byssoidea VB512170]|uniref:Type II toxin-antitoxin system RelE/ParE family toxin n=1 Tax=Hassallia byssoidea VB512170 TaxID=1304833 RepID=A0A846H1S1_9CYAN|nr:type II toxin-antitoxin system RelE/ParE family toxin [Hassalia byssoidea]NEU71717.1 type II toxin-antitoxin system RelE/ParE family toxin [Hassalia byssoidea VB512170]
MQLSFSPQAALDLEEIGDYIARDNPERALSFLAEIEAYCYRVAQMPNAFPRREDLAPGLQMAVHGNYLILFRVQERSVRIERIVHGARRLGDLV